MRSPGLLASTLAVLALAADASSQAPAPKPAPRRAPVANRTAPPPPLLEGVVRGPDRKPIENALVVAAPAARPFGNRFDHMPVSTRTDGGGRFRLALRTREPQTVRVEASGLAAATRRDVTPGTSLTFDLAAGGVIEGTVRDGDSNEPVANLRVEAWQSGAVRVADVPDSGRVSARTDAHGRFTLKGLANGRYDVFASGRGRTSRTRSSLRPGSRVDLVAFASGSVFGTVLGADGKPVPGTSVTATTTSGGWSPTDLVDERGAFEMNGLGPGGVFNVVARAPGYAPAITPDVAVDPRTAARVDLVLRPGARVVGRLLDANDRPVSGRLLPSDLAGQPVPYLLLDALRAEAAADGRFAIEDVPPGEHVFRAKAPRHAEARVEATVGANARVVDLGDVRLEVGHAIRGRVRTKAGAPIADAVVRAHPRESRHETGVEARSEADGSFVLAGVTPTVVIVTAEAAGFGPQEKTAEPDGEPLELVLLPAGSMRGLIVDDRSRPVESFRVTAQSARGGSLGVYMPLTVEDSSGDGRFTLPDVPPGAYSLSISAPDLVSTDVPDVKVAEGQAVDVGTVRMSTGGIVRGSVVDEQGAAVAGASVSAAPSRRAMNARRGGFQATEPTESDGSGAFELRALGEGELEVKANHPSFVGAAPVTVRVDARRPATDVRLVLTRGGRIEGSVRGRDGSPRAGQSVQASSPSLDRYFQGLTTTAADGSFVIEHVPAGPIGILVSSGSSFAPRKTVDVRDGETTTVEIVVREILLGGRVTRSGAPGSGLRIQVSNTGPRLISRGAATGAPQWWTADTREDGSFEMLVSEPNTYHLAVSSTDGKTSLPGRTVEVPDVDAHSVEIAYGGVPVAGVVIDEVTEAPIAYAQVGALGTNDAHYGTATTGADGKFQLDLEPDEYALSAHASGYLAVERRVTVGTGAAGDVRLALAKGQKIAGKVVDAAGQPAGGVLVRTLSAGQGTALAHSLADGSFAIESIAKGTYTLLAEGQGTFAIRPGVTSGSKDVVLSLQPGGRLAVTVTGPGGAPLAGAIPLVTRVNGLPVGFFGRPSGPTDASGRTELLAPAGDLELWARTETSGGPATASVASGQTAAVSIQVKAGAQAPE
jgi:hypothetical protein